MKKSLLLLTLLAGVEYFTFADGDEEALRAHLSLFFSRIEWRENSRSFFFLTQKDLRGATWSEHFVMSDDQKELVRSAWMELKANETMVVYEPVCRVELKNVASNSIPQSLQVMVAKDSFFGERLDSYLIPVAAGMIETQGGETLGEWSWPFQALWTNSVGFSEYKETYRLRRVASCSFNMARDMRKSVESRRIGDHAILSDNGTWMETFTMPPPVSGKATVVWSVSGFSETNLTFISFVKSTHAIEAILGCRGEPDYFRFRDTASSWVEYGSYNRQGTPLRWISTLGGLLVPNEKLLIGDGNGLFRLSDDNAAKREFIDQVENRLKLECAGVMSDDNISGGFVHEGE